MKPPSHPFSHLERLLFQAKYVFCGAPASRPQQQRLAGGECENYSALVAIGAAALNTCRQSSLSAHWDRSVRATANQLIVDTYETSMV